MIPVTAASGQTPEIESWPWPTGAWRRELRSAVGDVDELLGLLGLGGHGDLRRRLASRQFPLRVPRGFVRRMRVGDPDDPLLRQVLPEHRELEPAEGFEPDPLRESELLATRGVLHKYAGRALLVVTGACAVHCRYCFRRHFPYDGHRLGGEWSAALEYLRRDETLTEVILSGGDPLALSDTTLAPLAEELGRVPHLRRLRVHTRLPVVLPERIDADLVSWLTGGRLHPVMVIHANHAREIDERVAWAMGLLRRRGVSLLNQSVLLRGVNDSATALCELSETLFEVGVLPYYLHMLDPVAGAAHFALPEERALELVEQVRGRLPGYLVPRLVREIPGADAKRPLGRPGSGDAGRERAAQRRAHGEGSPGLQPFVRSSVLRRVREGDRE